MNETMNQTNSPETEPAKTAWDDLAETSEPAHATMEYQPYGIEFTNLKEINIDSQEGRFDYLSSLVENARSLKSERLRVLEDGFYDHIREAEPSFAGFSDAGVLSLEDETRNNLELINAEKTILENLDFSNSSVVQALKAKSDYYFKKFIFSDGMSEAATTKFDLMHRAATELYRAMVDEVKDRRQASSKES